MQILQTQTHCRATVLLCSVSVSANRTINAKALVFRAPKEHSMKVYWSLTTLALLLPFRKPFYANEMNSSKVKKWLKNQVNHGMARMLDRHGMGDETRHVIAAQTPLGGSRGVEEDEESPAFEGYLSSFPATLSVFAHWSVHLPDPPVGLPRGGCPRFVVFVFVVFLVAVCLLWGLAFSVFCGGCGFP